MKKYFNFTQLHLASALEIVYITPYFLKLELNDLLDATFWMIPVFLTTLLVPFVNFYAKSLHAKRIMKLASIGLSALGCFAFAYLDELFINSSMDWSRKKTFLSWSGLIAFCLIDVANEVALVSLVNYYRLLNKFQ